MSWRLLRFSFVPGVLLGIVLTAATVGLAAVALRYGLLPGLSWQSALMIGAIAALFDTRLFHEAKGRPHVPRAVADALKARELVGRAVVLATVGLLTEDVDTRTSLALAEHFGLDIAGGALVGLVVGRAVVFLQQRIDPAPIEIAVSLATPFGAALVADMLGLSRIAAITAAALIVSAIRVDGRTGKTISSSETRISATAFGEEASLIISSALYMLAGRALPEALGALSDWRLWQVALAVAGLFGVVLAVQFGASILSTRASPIADALQARAAQHGPRRTATAAVMTWSSTRSVIGLVIALAVPADSPDHYLVPRSSRATDHRVHRPSGSDCAPLGNPRSGRR